MSGQVDKDPQAPPRGEIKKPPKITNREPNNVGRGLEGGAKERSMPYIVTGLFSVLVVWVQVCSDRDKKEREADKAEVERHAAVRAEESRLSMEFMSASCKLGVVTAKAVTGQHTNGDVEEAMQAAQNRYYNFINSTAAKQIIRA